MYSAPNLYVNYVRRTYHTEHYCCYYYYEASTDVSINPVGEVEEPSTKEPKLDLSVVRKEPKLDQPVVRKEPKLDQPVVRKEPKLDQTVVGKEPMSDQSVVRKTEEVDREPVADSRAGLSPGTVRKKHRMAALGENLPGVRGQGRGSQL